MKKKEREKERMEKGRKDQRLFTAAQSSDFDLLRKGDSWIFPNSPAASAV